MQQAQDYFAIFDRSVAWGIYLGASLLLLGIMIWLTRRWQRNLRWLLLALLAVAVFMPAPIPGQQAQSPAFVIVALGALSHDVEVIAPVLVRFALAAVLVVILVAIEGVWWRARQRVQAAASRARAAGKNRARP